MSSLFRNNNWRKDFFFTLCMKMIKLTEWDLQRDPRPNGRGCLEGLAPSHQKQTSGEGESTSNLVLKQKNIVNLGLKSPTCSISSRTRQVLPYSLSKIVYSSPPVHWWPICGHITAIWCCTNKDLAGPVFEPPAQGCWHAARG